MARKTWCGLLLIALSCAGWQDTAAHSPDSPTKNPGENKQAPGQLKLPTRQEAMAAKLKGSQVILEGIALNDFDKIQTSSRDLIDIIGVTDFLNAYKGQEYLFHVESFRRPVVTIQKKAKEKNMDGVLLAYNDMTLSCMKCHQAMRDKKFEIKAGDR